MNRKSINNLFDVTDDVILVTGAGNGIGRGILLGLAAAGAKVIAWDVSEQGLSETMAEAKASGWAIDTSIVDVTDKSAVQEAMEAIIARHGCIDTVFINAGVAGKAEPAIDMSLENWRNVHSVNLDGAFITAQVAAQFMKKAVQGRIVFTASVWGLRGVKSAEIAPYMSSKGAIINLTRQLALEWAQYNINVNSIAPAGFITSLGAGELDPSFGDWLIGKIPLNRMVPTSQMMGPAQFLASAASAWVTGVTLPVDGGYLTE